MAVSAQSSPAFPPSCHEPAALPPVLVLGRRARRCRPPPAQRGAAAAAAVGMQQLLGSRPSPLAGQQRRIQQAVAVGAWSPPTMCADSWWAYQGHSRPCHGVVWVVGAAEVPCAIPYKCMPCSTAQTCIFDCYMGRENLVWCQATRSMLCVRLPNWQSKPNWRGWSPTPSRK